jgi:hypothetical protein
LLHQPSPIRQPFSACIASLPNFVIISITLFLQ